MNTTNNNTQKANKPANWANTSRRLITIDEAKKHYYERIQQSENKFDITEEGEVFLGMDGRGLIECLVPYVDGNAITAYYLISYNITADDLREGTQFIEACLTDADVNHALCNVEPGHALPARRMLQLMDWWYKKSDFFPITPCGLVNYVDSYLHGESAEDYTL